MDRYLSRRPVQIGLAVVSIVAAVSVGGGFVAGVVLVPLLLMTARHVSVPAAIGVVFLATILVAEVAWAATYLAVGEQRPLIWAVPLAASLVVLGLGVRSLGAARSTSPG